MKTVDCNECGHSICIDDFIVQCCPICDSYMELNRLNVKVEPSLLNIIRISPVHELER